MINKLVNLKVRESFIKYLVLKTYIRVLPIFLESKFIVFPDYKMCFFFRLQANREYLKPRIPVFIFNPAIL